MKNLKTIIATIGIVGVIVFQIHQEIVMRKNFHDIDVQFQMDDVDIKNLIEHANEEDTYEKGFKDGYQDMQERF